jgi:hypothetical protein
VLLDIPVIFIQVVIFGVIMYFMTNLDVNVSKFFIYELFVYVTTICITALYRMFAALSPTIDDAVRFSGIGKQFPGSREVALRCRPEVRSDIMLPCAGVRRKSLAVLGLQ